MFEVISCSSLDRHVRPFTHVWIFIGKLPVLGIGREQLNDRNGVGKRPLPYPTGKRPIPAVDRLN